MDLPPLKEKLPMFIEFDYSGKHEILLYENHLGNDKFETLRKGIVFIRYVYCRKIGPFIFLNVPYLLLCLKQYAASYFFYFLCVHILQRELHNEAACTHHLASTFLVSSGSFTLNLISLFRDYFEENTKYVRFSVNMSPYIKDKD